MTILGQIDDFFREAWSPTLVILALAGLVGIWVAAPIARLVVEKWFGKKVRQFNKQFATEHQQIARNNFAWLMQIAYEKEKPEGDLYRALLRVKFPDDFPETNTRVHEYARSINWPDVDSEELYSFVQKQMDEALDGTAEKKSNNGYWDLLNTVRIVGKFWDDWGLEISEGRLRANSVKRQIEANKPAIIALTLAELAIDARFSWDPGPGRVHLFKLAREGVALKQKGFFQKQWEKLRGTR